MKRLLGLFAVYECFRPQTRSRDKGTVSAAVMYIVPSLLRSLASLPVPRRSRLLPAIDGDLSTSEHLTLPSSTLARSNVPFVKLSV